MPLIRHRLGFAVGLLVGVGDPVHPSGPGALPRRPQPAQPLDHLRLVGQRPLVVQQGVEHLVVAGRRDTEPLADRLLLAPGMPPPLLLERQDRAVPVRQSTPGLAGLHTGQRKARHPRGTHAAALRPDGVPWVRSVTGLYQSNRAGTRPRPAPTTVPTGFAMILLTNARIVLPDGVRPDGWLRLDGRRIAEVGPAGSVPEPSYTDPHEQTMDLGGRYLLPGYVDIHTHGGGGAAFSSGDIEQALPAAAFHRGHGTTTVMASTVSTELDVLERYLSDLAGLVEVGLLACLHLEGPFLSKARCGAHDPALL